MGARTLDLLRRWDLLADPGDRGLKDRWFESAPTEGWVGGARSDQAWQHALGHAFDAVAWYRRRVRLPKKWFGPGTRIWIRFEAVATDCRVWVNGREVGSHTGDYVPFEFDITEAVCGQANPEIVCRVDQIKGVPPSVVGQEPWGGHITKGFHDVLGLQHGGIWGGVSVRVTGPVSFRPNGLVARGDDTTGRVRVVAEFQPHESAAELTVTLTELGDGTSHVVRARITPGQTRAELDLGCGKVERWSPESPSLGRVEGVLRTRRVPARDEAHATFAFRTVRVGGRDNRRVLFNGRPVLIRGVLDWGVEPEHIAPAPTTEQIRARFLALRERGFNCVCLCMVYPPERFFEIADETGMLLWLVLPVWKSSMAPEHMPEYKRLFTEFFRRARRHPSVALVSATCEHERFDPGLGAWWWDRARDEMPDTLLQVQTGFLAWTDAHRVDLYDEHVYDNSGRWARYFEDLEGYLADKPPRPFVMGESIIGTHWPDTGALVQRLGEERPWWAPKGLDGFVAFEEAVRDRFGNAALERLRAHARSFSLAQRKFQSEMLRAHPTNAGWVMNHLRDVSVCQCGFEDDLGRWRETPEQLRPFLGERALLLRAPRYACAVASGESVALGLGLSNFGPAAWAGRVGLSVVEGDVSGGGVQPASEVFLDVAPGEVEFATIELPARSADAPTPIEIGAQAPGVVSNRWRLWRFPVPAHPPEGVVRFDVAPFDDAEREPSFEERRYSAGWALACESWRPRLPDPARLLPHAPVCSIQGAWPKHDTLSVVTTRLTDHLLVHLERGGRVLLLASRASGNPPTGWINLYGQVPLIPERSHSMPHALLEPGESEWVLNTLGMDLNRNACLAVPTHELGIAHLVEPVVRSICTHDKGGPEMQDQVFLARVGEGLLCVSTLDHDNPAGRYLLSRLIVHIHAPEAPDGCTGSLTPEVVRAWVHTD